MAANEREITADEVREWCKEFQSVVSFIEVSAKTSENVAATFLLAVRQWKKNERNRDLDRDLIDGPSARIDLTRKVPEGRATCCSGARNAPSQQMHHEILQ